MIPPPPRSTLFPYTTLFRSHVRVACPPIIAPCFYGIDMSTVGELYAPQFMKGKIITIEEQQADRKSTRLNSSHLGISYAVFCLKKKNTTNYHKPYATF